MIKVFRTISITGPFGIGDSVYMYPIIKWYLERDYNVVAYVRHLDLFDPLTKKFKNKLKLQMRGDDPAKVAINCSYIPFKTRQKTTQFEDMCLAANVETDLKIDVSETPLNIGNNVCLVRAAYPGLGRHKSTLLCPQQDKLQSLIDLASRKFDVIVITYDSDLPCYLQNISGILKVHTASELVSVVNQAKQVISQPGNMIAIAEATNTPIFALFSHKMKTTENDFIRFITPEKIRCKKTTICAYDDENKKSLIHKWNQMNSTDRFNERPIDSAS